MKRLLAGAPGKTRLMGEAGIVERKYARAYDQHLTVGHNTISANSLMAVVKSHFLHRIQKSITDPPPHPAKQCQ
jgi:hypothetical protein